MEKVVYLSPSEHGVGANKCLHAGCYEDKHTRPIAEAAAKYLTLNGFKVVIAKEGTSMRERCAESDKIGAAFHIPIHTNAYKDSSTRYLMLMFYANDTVYKKIFNAIAPRLEAVYPNNTVTVFSVRKDLYEVNQPKAKTVYCELGFHTNKTDCDQFIHKPDMVGKALAHGICDYFGVEFKESTTPSVKPSAPEKKKVLEEDGLWGKEVTKYTQKFLGTVVDGVVSNQLNNCKKYMPNMLAVSWEFENIAKGGSPMIKALQKLVGAKVDGYAGKDTIKCLQKYLKKRGYYTGAIDSIAGYGTVIGWQKYLNTQF